MAVIVTGMDMPNDCLICPLHTEYMSNVICRKTGSKIGITCACYERMKDCPLKPIDGLIESVENTMILMGIPQANRVAIMDRISEYCGMEENNANSD